MRRLIRLFSYELATDREMLANFSVIRIHKMAVEWRVKNTNTFTEPVGGDKIHGMLAGLETLLGDNRKKSQGS